MRTWLLNSKRVRLLSGGTLSLLRRCIFSVGSVDNSRVQLCHTVAIGNIQRILDGVRS